LTNADAGARLTTVRIASGITIEARMTSAVA
jgi:hypothetical protein